MRPKVIFAMGVFTGMLLGALIVGTMLVTTISITRPVEQQPVATPAPMPDTGHQGDCEQP